MLALLTPSNALNILTALNEEDLNHAERRELWDKIPDLYDSLAAPRRQEALVLVTKLNPPDSSGWGWLLTRKETSSETIIKAAWLNLKETKTLPLERFISKAFKEHSLTDSRLHAAKILSDGLKLEFKHLNEKTHLNALKSILTGDEREAERVETLNSLHSEPWSGTVLELIETVMTLNESTSLAK